MSKISIKSFQFKNFQNEKIFIHCQVQNQILTSVAYSNLRCVHVIQVLKTAIQFVKTQLEIEEKISTEFRNFKSNHLDQFGIKITSISTNSNLRKKWTLHMLNCISISSRYLLSNKTNLCMPKKGSLEWI